MNEHPLLKGLNQLGLCDLCRAPDILWAATVTENEKTARAEPIRK